MLKAHKFQQLRHRIILPALAGLLSLPFVASAFAQSVVSPPTTPLITQPISDSALITLSGNTRPEAKIAANDRGRVPDSMAIPDLMLQLQRSPAQEQALETLIDQLHDPNSPNFHHWLSAAELGAQFGPASSDLQTITNWLSQHGFTVSTVYPNGMAIAFSGTAGQIRAAFHTEIHYLEVNGVRHFANMSDPQIPVALAPVVVGIPALHDFRPTPLAVKRPQSSSLPSPQYTENNGYWVTPPDLATIYNFNPVFSGGTTGGGQTIYILEDTDLYGGTTGGTNSDWSTFRSGFGIPLSSYPQASLNTLHPGGCTDPGLYGPSEAEAAIDVEYASAAAPNAALEIVACNGFVGALNTMFANTITYPPSIISISYGYCETNNGSANNAAYNSAYQTGVAEGWSIFVSAGDQGAGGCERATTVTHGINVNSFASTPYDVAVGGTDYSDTYSGTNTTYWSSTNSASNGSALSYIPEIPWNTTCGSQLFATYEGYATTYGSSGLCNSGINSFYLENWAGSGGPSACATGSPSTPDVVSGSCAGWAKPSWQSGFLSNPTDGVRDLPDVSMFASFGPWNHGYVICFSDTSNGGVTCNGTASGWNYDWGGTSFGAPIWAGIQALINQKAGGAQGLPNYRYYQLAAKEYGTGGSSSCNSSQGNAVSSSCIFYDVTLGDNDVPCTGSYNCYLPSGTYGVLSTSTSSYAPAYPTQTGWDFATGIGTPNVANLVNGWTGGGSPLTDTHDFNADNKSDIAWRNSNNDVSIWLMNGTTVLQSPDLGNVPAAWTIFGQRDFNGDGKADILWRNSNGDVAIWFMNGTTVTSAPDFANVPSSWVIAGTGDFNGDGYGDILWRNSDGDVSIWLMHGTQLLQGPDLGNVPTTWTIAGTGDFNGDGKTDILWRNSNGDVAIWFMNGTQIISSPDFTNVPISWTIVGTGDFNGDGKSDILWRNSNGDYSIWLMNGTQVLQGPDLGNVLTTWSIVETGDFNGDGKSDILWRNSNGDLSIWFMNGTTTLSTHDFGIVPTTWTVQGANAD